jgi:hypothetical protein
LNITDLLFDKKNTDAIGQLAQQFGINEAQVRDAISSLAPSLSRGMDYHAKNEGMDGLLDALKTGNHSRYLDNPDLLGRKETVDEGNSILGHIFGTKEVSRHVAKEAAEQTGLGSSLLKKMLPVIATMVMASLGKNMFGGGRSPAPQESTGFLTKMFDADNDGSMIDDALGMAFKMAFK